MSDKETEQPTHPLGLTHQEAYDLISRAIEDLKLQYVKAEISMEVMKVAKSKESILSRTSPEAKAMNEQSMTMLHMQLLSIPTMLDVAKQMKFGIYEQLKKDGNTPAK